MLVSVSVMLNVKISWHLTFPTKTRNNAQDPWICNTFGFKIRLHNSDPMFIGTWVRKTLLTISPNITYCISHPSQTIHHTISMCITPQTIYYLPRSTAPIVIWECWNNTHGYSTHTPLPILPVLHDTWTTKLICPEAWTPSTTLIAC